MLKPTKISMSASSSLIDKFSSVSLKILLFTLMLYVLSGKLVLEQYSALVPSSDKIQYTQATISVSSKNKATPTEIEIKPDANQPAYKLSLANLSIPENALTRLTAQPVTVGWFSLKNNKPKVVSISIYGETILPYSVSKHNAFNDFKAAVVSSVCCFVALAFLSVALSIRTALLVVGWAVFGLTATLVVNSQSIVGHMLGYGIYSIFYCGIDPYIKAKNILAEFR